VHDSEQEPGEHQPDRHLRVDAGPASPIRGITILDLCPKPTEVKNAVYASKDVIVGNQIP
jgi:hypothetical protein